MESMAYERVWGWGRVYILGKGAQEGTKKLFAFFILLMISGAESRF